MDIRFNRRFCPAAVLQYRRLISFMLFEHTETLTKPAGMSRSHGRTTMYVNENVLEQMSAEPSTAQ